MSGNNLGTSGTSALDTHRSGRSSKLNRAARHNSEGHIVTQRVHRHPLLNSSGERRRMDGPVELPGAEWLNRIEPGKQPATV